MPSCFHSFSFGAAPSNTATPDKPTGGFSFGTAPALTVTLTATIDNPTVGFSCGAAPALTATADKPTGEFSFGATTSCTATTAATSDKPVGGFSFGSSSTNTTPFILNSDKPTSGLAFGSNPSAPTIQSSSGTSVPSFGVFGSSNIASQNLQGIPTSESAAASSSFSQTAPFTQQSSFGSFGELMQTSAQITSPFGITLQSKTDIRAAKNIPSFGVPASRQPVLAFHLFLSHLLLF